MLLLFEYPIKLTLLVLSIYKNFLLTLISIIFPWNLLAEEEDEDKSTGGGSEGNGRRRRKNAADCFVSETMKIDRCHSYRSARHPESNFRVVELELKMKELHETLAKVVNDLEAKVKANEALNTDLDSLRRVTRKLENTVSNLQDENEGLLENLKLAKKERDDYMTKEQETRKDLQLAEKECDEYKTREQKTRAEDQNNKRVWKMRLDDMQKKQIKYKNLNKALRDANDTLMKKKIELEKEKTELATENYNLLTENANLEELVDELEDQRQETAVHKTFGNWLFKEKIRNKDSVIEELQEEINKLNDLMKSEQYQSDNDSGETSIETTTELLSQLPVTKAIDALPSESGEKVPSSRPGGTPDWNENDLEKLKDLMHSIKTTQLLAEQEEANKSSEIVEKDIMTS